MRANQDQGKPATASSTLAMLRIASIIPGLSLSSAKPGSTDSARAGVSLSEETGGLSLKEKRAAGTSRRPSMRLELR